MSYHIEEIIRYRWVCDAIGCYTKGEPRVVQEKAEIEGQNHSDFHDLSQLVGYAIKGKVFSRKTDVTYPGVGHIDDVKKAALDQGYQYFEFNEMVYPSSMQSMDDAICYAKDVPGL